MAVELSNRSYLSQHISSTLGEAMDKIMGRDFLASALCSFVNNAVLEDTSTLKLFRFELFENKKNEKITINLGNGVVLEGIRMGSELPAKGAIFFALGSGGCYEKIAYQNDPTSQLVNFFKSYVGKDIEIFVVNPRGIGNSMGEPSYQAWVTDMFHGISEVLKHHRRENVLVYGHSVGAWLAVDAVKAFKDLPFVADSTFANFANVAYHNCGGGVKGTAAYALATFAKWNADVTRSYESIFKRSMLVFSHEDRMVPKEVSLFTSLVYEGAFAVHEDSPNYTYVLNKGSQVHTRTENEKRELGDRLRKMMKLDG